jgi:hypothetical protein
MEGAAAGDFGLHIPEVVVLELGKRLPEASRIAVVDPTNVLRRGTTVLHVAGLPIPPG